MMKTTIVNNREKGVGFDIKSCTKEGSITTGSSRTLGKGPALGIRPLRTPKKGGVLIHRELHQEKGKHLEGSSKTLGRGPRLRR